MIALRRELENLILKLEDGRPAAGSREHQTLQHLLHIRVRLENGAHPEELAAAFAALERFWLASIAWCSTLSRDVEKLLIDYADFSADTPPDI